MQNCNYFNVSGVCWASTMLSQSFCLLWTLTSSFKLGRGVFQCVLSENLTNLLKTSVNIRKARDCEA